jgi:hypothetical protein
VSSNCKRKDYAVAGEKLWERFNRLKEEQWWYYQSLLLALSGREDNKNITQIIEEFSNQVKNADILGKTHGTLILRLGLT